MRRILGHSQQNRQPCSGVQQSQFLDPQSIFRCIPRRVLPEEVIQISNRVEMQPGITTEELLYFIFSMQKDRLHEYTPPRLLLFVSRYQLSLTWCGSPVQFRVSRLARRWH